MAEFGDILEELLKDKGMTQKDLSEIIYVTTGTISNYESGQYMPDLQKLITLADYFGVTLDYLTGRSASNLSPDVFHELIAPKMTVGNFIEDFKSLSPDRQKALLLIMQDMKISRMLNQYSKKENS